MRLLDGLRYILPSASRFGFRYTLQLIRGVWTESKSARRARMMAFRLARGATLHRAVDVTEVWNRSHPHLSPLEQQTFEGELLRCPSCGDERAIRILAHYRLGARRWVSLRSVLSCLSCHHYNLPIHELFVPWVKQVLTAQSVKPTRIDARLWTDATECLTLEPTTVCNFDCWYCVGRHMKQEHLTYENFVKIIDGFPSIKRLQLVGEGEPLLNKRFFDMVAYAKTRGIWVSITTNGSMFTPSVVEKLCDLGLDCLQISIDSSDPERFAETRVGGDLEEIWNGIERLTTRRNERGLTRPIVLVRGTLLAETKDDLAEIVREAKKRGVDGMSVFQSLNLKESYVAIYPEDKKRHTDDAASVARSIGVNRIRSELPFLAELEDIGAEDLAIWPNHLRQSCDLPSMYSQLAGDVTPCCQIKTITSPAWNLAEHGVEAVIRDEEYENMRFNLWNGVYLDTCESCRGYSLAPFSRGTPQIRALQ